MQKKPIPTVRQESRIVGNILSAIDSRENFLVLGHKNPDEDCIASMVAFSLIVRKFDKHPVLFLGDKVHEHFRYLLDICKYNSIKMLEEKEPLTTPIDAVVICDTPKPSMVLSTDEIQQLFDLPEVVKIEFDHHLDADSEYIGDEGYRLVTVASSAAELVGHLLLKLKNREDLLSRYQITDLMSRNLVLAILTGIIGDSKMGQFIKTKRERHYYQLFSGLFNRYLTEQTTRDTNFSDKDEVFQEMQKLTKEEEHCYQYFMKRKLVTSSVGYVALDGEDTAPLYESCSVETIVVVARAVADSLAEESGKLGLVAYYDEPGTSDLIQFRIRRSRGFRDVDLRKLLTVFSIKDGGGHEGAIGFRISRQVIEDWQEYIGKLVRGIENEIG